MDFYFACGTFLLVLAIALNIALPEYVAYRTRGSVRTIVHRVDGEYITKVAQFWESNKRFPETLEETGLKEKVIGGLGHIIVLGRKGEMIVTLSGNLTKSLEGQTITFKPVVGEKLRWDCSGGTLQEKLRPDRCR